MLLLGIADGTAFELIDHPEKLNDKKTWLSLKKMILAVLKEQELDLEVLAINAI